MKMNYVDHNNAFVATWCSLVKWTCTLSQQALGKRQAHCLDRSPAPHNTHSLLRNIYCMCLQKNGELNKNLHGHKENSQISKCIASIGVNMRKIKVVAFR